MERVPGNSANVRGLAALLAKPLPSATVESLVPAIDPAAELDRQRQQVLEAARKEGYETGLAKAEREIGEAKEHAREELRRAHVAETSELADANRRLKELLKSVAVAADGMSSEIEACVAEIAYAAVVRFLGETEGDGEVVRRVCRQALEEYQQRPVVLKVAREDFAAVEALASDADVSVEADSRLHAGQCRLQTRKGDYDTSLEVRLESLKLAFLRGAEKVGGPA